MTTENVMEQLQRIQTSLDERRNQQAPKGFESPDLNEWGELHRAAAPLASAADFVAFRLVELRTKRIAGGFDVEHLQAIHRHVYQDALDWAGGLRSPDLESPINRTLDRLARENFLKGKRPEEWASSASEYVRELAGISPFAEGNDIALREFMGQLARKNGLSLQWDSTDLHRAVEMEQQEEQGAYLRRILMLAVTERDTLPSRGHTLEEELERFL